MTVGVILILIAAWIFIDAVLKPPVYARRGGGYRPLASNDPLVDNALRTPPKTPGAMSAQRRTE